VTLVTRASTTVLSTMTFAPAHVAIADCDSLNAAHSSSTVRQSGRPTAALIFELWFIKAALLF